MIVGDDGNERGVLAGVGNDGEFSGCGRRRQNRARLDGKRGLVDARKLGEDEGQGLEGQNLRGSPESSTRWR